MKKILLILIAGLFSLSSFGQIKEGQLIPATNPAGDSCFGSQLVVGVNGAQYATDSCYCIGVDYYVDWTSCTSGGVIHQDYEMSSKMCMGNTTTRDIFILNDSTQIITDSIFFNGVFVEVLVDTISSIQGVQGIQGQDGIQGPQGDQGVTGADGPKGNDGPQGPVGPQGADGIQGPKGDDGIQGPQGEQGADGPQGDTGPAGATGAAGINGVNGADGQNGTDGADGLQGPQGLQGPAGVCLPCDTAAVNGVIGIPGPIGPQGVQGIQGVAGTDGVDGVDGIDGIDGIGGAIGPAGPQGIQGNDGAQGDIGPAGPQGIAGEVGATGPQGNTGIQGIQGIQGDQGIQGEDGVQGVAGPAGIQGPQGIPGILTVQNTNGVIMVPGPAGIQGPAGEAGPAGPQGVAGVQGATGPQGPAGLNGADGADGADGVDGQDGIDGAAGLAGIQGPQGVQGPKGDQGIQGVAGADGQNGADGATGPTGADGVQGVAGADGADGVNCWDGLSDLNGDGVVDVNDCRASGCVGVIVPADRTEILANLDTLIWQYTLDGNCVLDSTYAKCELVKVIEYNFTNGIDSVAQGDSIVYTVLDTFWVDGVPTEYSYSFCVPSKERALNGVKCDGTPVMSNDKIWTSQNLVQGDGFGVVYNNDDSCPVQNDEFFDTSLSSYAGSYLDGGNRANSTFSRVGNGERNLAEIGTSNGWYVGIDNTVQGRFAFGGGGRDNLNIADFGFMGTPRLGYIEGGLFHIGLNGFNNGIYGLATIHRYNSFFNGFDLEIHFGQNNYINNGQKNRIIGLFGSVGTSYNGIDNGIGVTFQANANGDEVSFSRGMGNSVLFDNDFGDLFGRDIEGHGENGWYHGRDLYGESANESIRGIRNVRFTGQDPDNWSNGMDLLEALGNGVPGGNQSNAMTILKNGSTQIRTFAQGNATAPTNLTQAQVTPNAALEVVSTDQGVVFPRVANVSAVTNPDCSETVYDLSVNQMAYWNCGTNAWVFY